MTEYSEMWKGVPENVYSDRVWKSVAVVEPMLSDLDTMWKEALQKTADVLQVQNTDPLQIPYELEKATWERAKAAGHPDFITISGPGAVGKGTLRAMLKIAKNTINDTTRAPRGEGENAEKDGVQYFFIDEKTLREREARGEYVYKPIFKPGRGWYAMQKSQIDDLLNTKEQFIVEDNIPVSKKLFEYVRKANPTANPLHLYILPPPPVMGTLALRLFARAEQTNDSRYLQGDKIEIPQDMIESTIGARQVEEYLPVVDLIKEGGNVLFLVNDDLKRMEEKQAEISLW